MFIHQTCTLMHSYFNISYFFFIVRIIIQIHFVGVSFPSYAFKITKILFILVYYIFFRIFVLLRLKVFLLTFKIYFNSKVFSLNCLHLKFRFFSSYYGLIYFQILHYKNFSLFFQLLRNFCILTLFDFNFCFYKFCKVTITLLGKSSDKHFYFVHTFKF